MRWKSRPIRIAPLLFFDIETTGLRPDRGARITEWALVDHTGLRLHWSVNLDADDYEERLASRLDALFEPLQQGIVVGHNLAFDLSFVAREADRLGLRGPAVQFIDTMTLARRLGLQTSDVRLGTLLDYFGCTPEEPLHTAPVDARATRALFWKLVAHAGLDTLADAGLQRLDWASF